MPNALDSCILKVERAKEHRNALNSYIRETFAVEANRPRLGIKHEPDTGEYVVFINYMPDLSHFIDRSSLFLGDAVHNLISALDRLTYQLADLNTGGKIMKPNSVQFPICDTVEQFKEKRRRYLSEIDPSHVTEIESFQGYHRIDESHSIGAYFHPLSMLRDLASTDKHRLPINLFIQTSAIANPTPALVGAYLTGLFTDMARVRPRIPEHFPPAELNAEIIRTAARIPVSEAQMQLAGHIPLNVAIDGNWGAVAVIDKIAAMVVNVIRKFEPFFKALT